MARDGFNSKMPHSTAVLAKAVCYAWDWQNAIFLFLCTKVKSTKNFVPQLALLLRLALLAVLCAKLSQHQMQ